MAVYDQELEEAELQFKETLAVRNITKVFGELRKNTKIGKNESSVAEKARVSLIRATFHKWLEAYDNSLMSKQQMEIEENALLQAGSFYNEKLVQKCYT